VIYESAEYFQKYIEKTKSVLGKVQMLLIQTQRPVMLKHITGILCCI